VRDCLRDNESNRSALVNPNLLIKIVVL
jgi:hypothetical protein